MLKPIFTKARLIKRNLLLAARSSGFLACLARAGEQSRPRSAATVASPAAVAAAAAAASMVVVAPETR